MQNTAHYRSTWLDPTLNKNFHWKSSCGMSQIAQISRRSPLQNPADLLEKRMARDGWKSNIFSFTVKKCLSQKCQPKSIRGSTSQLNWAFFCYFAIPKPRSYNTLEEIVAIKRKKKKEGTLYRSLNKSLAGSSNNSWTVSASWHCKSKPPLWMQPQIQTSTCLTVTVEKH